MRPVLASPAFPFRRCPRALRPAIRGGDTQVLLGAFFEIALAISVVGTATTLFPIVRRRSEGIALAYVVGRLLEAALIVVGIISLVSIVTLRQDAAGAAGGRSAY